MPVQIIHALKLMITLVTGLFLLAPNVFAESVQVAGSRALEVIPQTNSQNVVNFPPVKLSSNSSNGSSDNIAGETETRDITEPEESSAIPSGTLPPTPPGPQGTFVFPVLPPGQYGLGITGGPQFVIQVLGNGVKPVPGFLIVPRGAQVIVTSQGGKSKIFITTLPVPWNVGGGSLEAHPIFN